MFHYNNDKYDIRAKGVRCANVDDAKLDSKHEFGRLYYTVKEIKFAFWNGASKGIAYPEYGNKADRYMKDGTKPLDCLNWNQWNEVDKKNLKLSENQCIILKDNNFPLANKFC